MFGTSLSSPTCPAAPSEPCCSRRLAGDWDYLLKGQTHKNMFPIEAVGGLAKISIVSVFLSYTVPSKETGGLMKGDFMMGTLYRKISVSE